MSEELIQRIKELEKENKKLRLATQQWDHLQKVYRESNDQLQMKEQQVSEENLRVGRALTGGDLAWWEWNYLTGRVTFNEQRARILGYTLAELPATFGEIMKSIHPDDTPAVMNRLEACLKGETDSYEAEFRLKTRSGEWRWFLDKGRIIETDILGKPVLLAGALIDVHERKNLENELIAARDKAESDSRAKSQFLANMSHEIYTPMAGVIGMAEILKKSDLNREQEEYLEVVVDSANNLMSILNDIIEFSKIDAGKFEFHEKPFNLHMLLDDFCVTYGENAGQKGLDFLSYIDPDIPQEVVGDPARLRQVLKILCDNAIKFTEKGEVRLETDFVEWDDENVKVRFIVSDTGIGISESGIKKLFTSFSKLNPDETRKYGGGGLGLAIARRIISRMNGQISVMSKPGEGTSFSFDVVFERYHDSGISDQMKKLLHGSKILVVDPHEIRRGYFTSYFEHWDALVDQVTSGGEATTRVTHQSEIGKPYDLLVIENGLLGGSGLQFASSFRHDSVFQQSRVLLIYPSGEKITAQELVASGITAALGRPFTLHQLKTVLRKLILSQRTVPEEEPESDIHQIEDRKRCLRILLAEDNLINQKVALVTLEKMGHQTALAENGVQALAKATTEDWDLILMDIHMPEMDGLEATRRIREFESENPGRNPVPICGITANTSEEDEDKCYKAGMNFYISKPFKLAELIRILSHV